MHWVFYSFCRLYTELDTVFAEYMHTVAWQVNLRCLVGSEDQLCRLSLAIGTEFHKTPLLKGILVEGHLYGRISVGGSIAAHNKYFHIHQNITLQAAF